MIDYLRYIGLTLDLVISPADSESCVAPCSLFEGTVFLIVRRKLHVVQTGSGAQPASYTVDTGGCFPGSKAAGA
jgi:hypothetical protein